MKVIESKKLFDTHPDYLIISRIERVLIEKARGFENLRTKLPKLIRQAIDEVIDTRRTGRVSAQELEKTEKTYIGTKVEILVRDFFDLPKGILDLKIDGLDVDVKNTLGSTWMIPREAIGMPCVLVASDEARQTCFFGIFVAHLHNLTPGVNQDQKRSVASVGFDNIHWLLAEEPYPNGFWGKIGGGQAYNIMRGNSGNERVEKLFRQALGTPVGRDIIEDVARQKDYMKRVRKNGGARDALAREGIAILSGQYDSEIITALGLEPIGRDEFISFKPMHDTQIALLRRYNKID
ncbi:MAG TPA: NaeI family type II restriction endonuclease [Halothiobacillus sp.]|nr:NaeI family type II restriction endonuclease [Halothiobacillus sp.]